MRAQQKYFSWNLIASAFVDFLESPDHDTKRLALLI